MFKFSCMGLWPDGSSAYFQALIDQLQYIVANRTKKKNRYSSKPQDQFSNLIVSLEDISLVHSIGISRKFLSVILFIQTSAVYTGWDIFLPYFAFLFLLAMEWCILPVDPSNMCVLYWLFLLLNVTTSIYLYQVSTQLLPKGDCINRIWL